MHGVKNSEMITSFVERYKSLGDTVNIMKPTGYVRHQKVFHHSTTVRSAHAVFVLYLSENKQRFVPLTA